MKRTKLWGSFLLLAVFCGGACNRQDSALRSHTANQREVKTFRARLPLSSDLLTKNSTQSSFRSRSDVFVAKLSADGNALVYLTYLGGNDSDRAFGIAVDSTGSAYLVGETDSADFPTVNAVQRRKDDDCDIFIAKLNPAGSALIDSTYLGGNQEDFGNGIAVDAAGNAYITGSTRSVNFPTTANALQPFHDKEGDVFVAKLNPTGSALVYSTYLGEQRSGVWSAYLDISV